MVRFSVVRPRLKLHHDLVVQNDRANEALCQSCAQSVDVRDAGWKTGTVSGDAGRLIVSADISDLSVELAKSPRGSSASTACIERLPSQLNWLASDGGRLRLALSVTNAGNKHEAVVLGTV